MSETSSPYVPKNPVRLISAAALFDGHDSSINVMRRILQASGCEVIHLGHNRAVEEVARTYVDPANITQGALNRIEAAIRAYDPCISCSTHAVGRMPMQVIVLNPAGEIVYQQAGVVQTECAAQ